MSWAKVVLGRAHTRGNPAGNIHEVNLLFCPFCSGKGRIEDDNAGAGVWQVNAIHRIESPCDACLSSGMTPVPWTELLPREKWKPLFE